MKLPRQLRFCVLSCVVALGLAGAALTGAWFFRQPVVVVSDRGFDSLYGSSRINVARLSLFFHYFRSFRVASVADLAMPEAAEGSAFTVARHPLLVVFPLRYAAGATLYRERHPGIPCMVIGEDVVVDRRMNLYRAGRLAGRIASRGSFPAIILSRNGDVDSLSAFKSGLAASGCLTEPVALRSGDKAESGKIPGCLVVADPGELPIPTEWRQVPLVLFSWVDPSIVGDRLLALFDDSPWALLPGIMANMKPGSPRILPSRIILGGNLQPLSMKQSEIQSILRESPKKE